MNIRGLLIEALKEHLKMNEVLDFDKTEPYVFSLNEYGGSFDIIMNDETYTVNVNLYRFDKNFEFITPVLKDSLLEKYDNFINIGFNINGDENIILNSSLKILVRIFKTIINILRIKLNSEIYNDKTLLVFLAEERIDKKLKLFKHITMIETSKAEVYDGRLIYFINDKKYDNKAVYFRI
jgi:hypothetical protein